MKYLCDIKILNLIFKLNYDENLKKKFNTQKWPTNKFKIKRHKVANKWLYPSTIV